MAVAGRVNVRSI